MSTTVRTGRWTAGLVLVPIAAFVLSACAPKPASVPAPAQTTVKASATSGFDRAGSWDSEISNKGRPPAGPTCNWTSLETAVEQCHLTYRPYSIDSTNTSAQTRANTIAAQITPNQCSNGGLDDYHSGRPFQPTLQSQYPGMSPLGENLHCYYFSNGLCPSGNLGAIHARDAWLGSPAHKSTMDSFPVVNGGAACNSTSSFNPNQPGGVYVAVAQFHF